ncbi:Crp/Fnr family transcriptional regulator [Coprobacter tertius]|uniref:Crp/Fnr family transcriptional regulator n=1 Tax=Coprobacter tertius TaxID=2944915 RepID=A0ABT1MJB0_9BACT|nr:hypothetical protein [Coprobacter tertius]MCP9612702.1 hypothetical protein [Coprobacter tertius]
MDEFVDFLHSQLHLLPSQIELLKEKIKTHYFKKGDLLEGPAELDDRMYYIKKGGARSFYLKDGKDITFSFAFENDLLVSMRSNTTKKEFPELVEFLDETEAYSILIKPFSKIQKFKSLAAADFSQALLLKYNCFLEERIINLQCKSARERYDWVVGRFPELLQKANLGQIASFIGVTQETLSRIRSEKKKHNPAG